jgi:putative ATPase
VFVLERLSDDDIKMILKNAVERATPNNGDSERHPLSDDPGSSQTVVEASQESRRGGETLANEAKEGGFREISEGVMKTIVNLSVGDARTALSLLELVLTAPKGASDATVVSHLRRSVSSRYDRSGDDRYDMISALHKSIRGSDGGAALYWLARYEAGYLGWKGRTCNS